MGQQKTVCGCETQDKYHQHCNSHHHRSGSSAGVPWDLRLDPAQCPDHPCVGHHCDEQGYEEEGAAESDEVDFVVFSEVINGLDIVAGGDVQLTEIHSLFGDNKGHRGSKRQNPYSHTGNDCVPRPSPSQGVDGINDSKKSVHADASDEENRAIHVPVKCCSHPPAHERTKYPVVASKMVGDLEREQYGKDKVSAGQIQHVDGRGFLWSDPPNEGQHRTEIDWHADEAHQRVEGRYEDRGHRASEKQQRIF